MTTRIRRSYLTDITTSEGKLGRLGLICEIIAKTKVHDHNRLFEVIAEKAGITNYKVIGRHLYILSAIGLLVKTPEAYLVTSRGKALIELRSRYVGVLNKAEKTVFFKSFFSCIPEQLYWVIYTVGKNKRAKLNENAIEYFYSSPAKSIWTRTVEKAIRKGNKDRPLTRGMINKFETMLYWLSQLDITRKMDRVWLTEKGFKFLEAFPKDFNTKEFASKIYYIATLLYGDENIRCFDPAIHKNDLVNVLHKGNELFRGERDLSDLVAIQEFASAIFASSGIVLEEGRFYDIIQEFGLDGTIKSVILGRDGKPAFLVMN